MESRRQNDNRLLVVLFGDGCLGMFLNGECVRFSDLDDFQIDKLHECSYDTRLEIRQANKWPSLSCLLLIKSLQSIRKVV